MERPSSVGNATTVAERKFSNQNTKPNAIAKKRINQPLIIRDRAMASSAI